MLDKIWFLIWENKKGFLLGCFLNVFVIFYLGANIEWSYYDHADLSAINWILCILSTIHSIYITPFGIWHQFIKEHIKAESASNVSVFLILLYYVFYYILLSISGLVDVLYS